MHSSVVDLWGNVRHRSHYKVVRIKPGIVFIVAVALEAISAYRARKELQVCYPDTTSICCDLLALRGQMAPFSLQYPAVRRTSELNSSRKLSVKFLLEILL